MATKEETEKAVKELETQLKSPGDFTFHIPNWKPVKSKEGLWWMKSQLWEGFYVSHKIDFSKKQVFFKYWEYGEPEPNWKSIEYKT